jgi:hypothetical protein
VYPSGVRLATNKGQEAQEINMKTNTQSAIALQDGEARHMGGGVFVLLQRDEKRRPQNVAVTADDLRRLLASLD